VQNLNKNALRIRCCDCAVNITDYVPIAKPQMENVYMTQYDWKMLEEAGLIKWISRIERIENRKPY
jgi:hypothetical protein